MVVRVRSSGTLRAESGEGESWRYVLDQPELQRNILSQKPTESSNWRLNGYDLSIINFIWSWMKIK